MNQEDVIRFLNQPLSEWQRMHDSTPAGQLWELDELAAALATRAARLSAYISARRNGPHATAVKHQNRVARGVRQALGYTYKDDSVSF